MGFGDPPLFKTGYCTPYVVFDKYQLNRWTSLSMLELHEELEKLRKNVKGATDYHWDNTHFYISDIYGKLALQFQTSRSSISFWNARNSRFIRDFTEVTDEVVKTIFDYIYQIEHGKTMCGACQKWVSDYKTFSFAGAVCFDCYDPKVHLPPDTRGD